MRGQVQQAPSIRNYYRGTSIVYSYYAGYFEAPHAWTTRLSYTVPSGRRGLLQNAFLLYVRSTAPTTPGQVIIELITTGGDIAALVGYPAAVDNGRYASVPLGTILGAGERLELNTSDASVGGTVDYRGGFNVVLWLA